MGELSIKNNIVVLSILLLILISLSCVNAVQINETEPITYISENCTGEVLNADIGDFSALNDEINFSSQTKTLNLTKDYAYDPSNDEIYSAGITINIDDLVIDGHGHTINANHQARIFNIQADNVILKNIVIINGYSDYQGSAIHWTGAKGKVMDSTFKNSVSHNIGGAIYFNNYANVTNSEFINNSANFGGAIDFEENSDVENCKFEDNYAKYLGGAIFSSKHTNVFNSTFTKNEGGDGGGIYFFSKGLVENTLFEKNNAIGYGGAITNEGEVIVKNSNFLKNTGKYSGAIFLKGNGIIDNSTFSENSADKEAGAIDSYCDNASISNCIFNHNEALKGKSIQIINKHVKIENSTFNNDPSSLESEIYMECSDSTLNGLTFNNVTKKEDQAKTEPQKTTVVKKVTKKKTKITAKSKTFKSKTKTKKYTITLKTGKTPLKNKKIKLRLRGKTYSAKTNKKGKATFKLKIIKKGRFKATIRVYGDKYYKASKKTIYIKIKK